MCVILLCVWISPVAAQQNAPAPSPVASPASPDSSATTPDTATSAPPMRLLPPNMEPGAKPLADPTPVGPGAPAYYLGPGDQLQMIDYATSETDQAIVTPIAVQPDGTAVIPHMGVVRVQGLTVRQLNDMVNERVSKNLLQPEISIALTKPRPVAVYVLGEVTSPGIYSIDPGQFTTGGGARGATSFAVEAPPVVNQSLGGISNSPTTQDASNRTTQVDSLPNVSQLTVLTALQLAGGVKDTADTRSVRVTRENTGETLYVDIWRVMLRGERQLDIVLRPGDTVFVPKGAVATDVTELGVAADHKRRIRVWGNILAPGIYELKPEDDIYSVVARAGGFTRDAVTSSVLLSRVGKDGKVMTKKIPMPGRDFLGFAKKGQEVARASLRDGDVVIASTSYTKVALPKLSTAVLTLLAAATLVWLGKRIKDVNGGGQTISLF